MADIKNNLIATTDPTTADDSTQGYSIGSYRFNKNTGEMWQCTNAAAGAAEWIMTAFDDGVWPSGHARFGDGILAMADRTPTANTLFMNKFVFRKKVLIEAIGVHLVTQQAGAAVKLGIYSYDRVTGWAGNLVSYAGEILLDGSGAVSGDRTFFGGLSIYLNPGIYFAAAVMKTATTTQATVKGISSSVNDLYTRPKGQDLSGNGRLLTGTLAYPAGALPSVPPTMSYSTGGNDCAVMLAKG